MTSKPPVPLLDGVAYGPPPTILPPDIRKLLSSILNVPIIIVDCLWNELQQDVWETPVGEARATDAEIAKFTIHGSSFLIGLLNINSFQLLPITDIFQDIDTSTHQ